MQDAQRTVWNTQPIGGTPGVQNAVRLGWLSIVIMTLVIGLLLTDVAAAESGDDSVVVRLYPTSVVTSDEITLRDIAALDAEAEQMAGDWRVASAPLPGQSMVVDLERLEKVLTAGGANLSQWIVRGASRCAVSRPADPVKTTTRAVASAVKASSIQIPGKPNESTPTREFGTDPDTLEGALRQHIANRVTGLGGRPIIRFSSGMTKLLAMSRPTYDFRIIDTSDRPIGRVSFNVAVYDNGKFAQTVPVLAEVLLAKPVVVAAGNINRGQTIQGDDLRVEEQCFDRAEDMTSFSINALIGQRARRLIRQHSLIKPQDVESIPLVERNDLVTVWVRWGNLEVKSSACAMEDGCLGDLIQLRNEMSRQTFVAKITGHKTAELPKSAPEAMVAMSERTR